MTDINFYQVKDMSDEEKFDMYMKTPHEELVKMKIEEERILNTILKNHKQSS